MATAPAQANKELVAEYLEVLNAHDVDRMPDFYADDFTVDFMQDDGGSEAAGVEKIVEGFEELIEAFPDVTHDVKEMAAEGDWVLFRLELEGTHDGEYKGIEPTGQTVSWQHHGSVRVEDGEFVDAHGTMSRLWLLAQLGVDLPIEIED